jgi:hypothetical protein
VFCGLESKKNFHMVNRRARLSAASMLRIGSASRHHIIERRRKQTKLVGSPYFIGISEQSLISSWESAQNRVRTSSLAATARSIRAALDAESAAYTLH